ncbi:DUF452 family protein [bacterium]|nr:DUF452 family protein [bacterium]
MQSTWLIQTKKEKLLLFVNGWGMDAAPFRYLTSDRYDVLMLYDYRDLTPPRELAKIFKAYHEVYVMAWSFGVWVCQSIKDILPDRTVFSLAINGTLQPIHTRYGITPAIFEATLKNLTPRTCRRFYSNMFLEDPHAERFFKNAPQRSFDAVRNELAMLQRAVLATDDEEYMGFDTALISNFDIIIPSNHQMKFWKNQSTCRIIRAGHFPFYFWDQWEDILVHISHE